MDDFNISELLDVTGLPVIDDENMPVVYEPTVLVDIESNPSNRAKDLEDDYSKTRKNLDHQHQMLMAMSKIALENAKNSESPKHVEAFVSLMNSMSNVNKEILKVHREMGAITNESTNTKNKEPVGNTMNIENATVFVGTPAELMAKEGTQLEANSRNKEDLQGEYNVVDA